MSKKIILSMLFSLAVLFSGCDDEKQETADVGSMTATNEYVLTTLKNEQLLVKELSEGFILDSAKDKIVLFDIFATWCPPCQGAATHLSSLQEKFKDDLIIIGVSIEEGIENEKLEAFTKEHKAKYTLVNSEQNRHLVQAIASSLKLGERFPIPMMAMYKNGKLIKHYLGATQEEFIESDIKQALEN